MTWTDVFAMTGTMGDTVGGAANVATFVVALWAAKTAFPREIERTRKEHVLQVTAAAAREVWGATFGLLVALDGVRNPVSRGDPNATGSKGQQFLEERRPALEELSRRANDFVTAWSTAELHFDDSVDALLTEIWRMRATTVVALEAYARGLDARTPDLKAYEELFGSARSEEIRQLRIKAKGVLKAFALPKGDAAPPRPA